VVALIAGVLVTHSPSFPPKSKSYDVGVATAQVLVDTPDSQVAGVSSTATAGSGLMLGTLGTQANILADLMVEGPIKADIAQRAGLKPSQLVGVSAAVTVPSAAGSGSDSGPSAVSVPSGPNVFALTTQILTDSAAQTTFPIIEIDAQAPDRAKAIRLANAAVAGLQAYVSSEAADERIPASDRLSITNFGVSQASTQTRGPSPLMGFLVTLIVLFVGCVSILWILAMVRGWRSAAERERLGLGEPFDDDAEWVSYELPAPVDPARGPALPANRASQRQLLRTNGVLGKSNQSGPAPVSDYPRSPAEDTPGHGPALSSRRWSSRQWSSRRN
jgi:hypothetical protein